MRYVNPKVLEERKQRILQAVIHQFIKSGKPVGSSILTEDYDIELSPATIRNLMAELENDGYLTHPHTSAGRTPTDKGYRLYVDSLIELQKMVLEEEERVRQEYFSKIRQFEEVLSQTSRVLSVLSHYTGFVLAPKLEQNQLKYLELTKIEENKILIIMVTHTGMVKHHVFEASISMDRLSELNRLLNKQLRGMNLLEAKKKIIEKLEEFERDQREMLNLARSISRHIFDIEDVYLDGATNFLEIPEFHDFEQIKCLLKLNDNKELLADIFGKNINSQEGIKVLIGSETTCKELKNMSVISTVYKENENPIGVLGIIGPKRMEYPKMMALVNSVSKIVNKLLKKAGG